MIISINNLNDMRLLDLIAKSVRAEDRKIGLTSGCYDHLLQTCMEWAECD